MTTQTTTWDEASLLSSDNVVSDLDLVNQAKAGDVEAFSELVRRHERVVYNLAYRFMRDGTNAEDMAQEAFLKAFRLLRGFRGDCEFSTWMYRVTCSVCLTELNRRKKRGEVELNVESLTASVELDKESLDLGDVMRACVNQLPPRYERIITLYYLRELSYEEIAEKLDIPMGTLKTWMHRARKQLRRIVEREVYA